MGSGSSIACFVRGRDGRAEVTEVEWRVLANQLTILDTLRAIGSAVDSSFDDDELEVAKAKTERLLKAHDEDRYWMELGFPQARPVAPLRLEVEGDAG